MATFATIDQRGFAYIVEGDEFPQGFAVVIQKDGPLIGTATDAKWDGKCHRTEAGVDVSSWLPDQTRGYGVRDAFAAIEAAVRA